MGIRYCSKRKKDGNGQVRLLARLAAEIYKHTESLGHPLLVFVFLCLDFSFLPWLTWLDFIFQLILFGEHPEGEMETLMPTGMCASSRYSGDSFQDHT